MSDRHSLGMWVRTVASVVMLTLLLLRVDDVPLESLIPSWDRGAALWLVAALFVTAAGIVLSAVRWQAVLVALGLRTRIRTLLNHYLAGLFVGNFLPSTIGGDVLRIRRLAADNGDGADTFASVVLERLTGWVVLPLITLTALVINPGLRELGTASAVAFGISVVTLVLLSALLLVVAHPRIGGRATGTAGWHRFAGAVHLGLERFRHRPSAVLGVLLTGFAYQLVVVLAAFFAARALDLDHVGLTAVLAFMPAVAIAQAIPLSLGGLGIREGALALFLSPLGVAPTSALALGLLVYGLNLTVSLVGAPSFAVGSRPARALA